MEVIQKLLNGKKLYLTISLNETLTTMLIISAALNQINKKEIKINYSKALLEALK